MKTSKFKAGASVLTAGRRRYSPAAVALLMAVPLIAMVTNAKPAFSATSVTSVTFNASSLVAAGPSTWTVGFTTSGTGALASGTDTITIAAPTGTTFPSTAASYSVNGTSVFVDTDSATDTSGNTPDPDGDADDIAGISGGGTNSVTITTPVNVAVSGNVSVVVTGVVNPAAGTYPVSVNTSTDATPASSNSLTFYAPLTAGTSAILAGSPSRFESGDGNMTLDATAATDWNCFDGSGNFPSGPGNTSGNTCIVKSSAKAQDTAADPPNRTVEEEWVNGQKFDAQCPQLTSGNNPPKDEFVNVGSYSDTQLSSPFDTFFYGSMIRSTNNGNASGDVEFNQNSIDHSTTTVPCRTSGDRLLAYDFLNGGSSQVALHVLTWIASKTDTAGGNNTGSVSGCYVKTDIAPCWGANVLTPDPANFNGASNSSATYTAPNDGLNNAVALGVNQFSEFGINLTAALGLSKCSSFPQEVWESRSSGSSFTSNPQDIEISHTDIETCGEIKIIKQTDPRGQDQAFNFTSSSSPLPANSTAGGVACTSTDTDSTSDAANSTPDPDNDADDPGVQSAANGGTAGSFCLNDTKNQAYSVGSLTDNSTGNTVDEKEVSHGTYTVTEQSEPGSFSSESVTCTSDNTSGSSAAVSGVTATINLASSGLVTCLYVNKLHAGAVLITKTGKDKACTAANTPTITNGVCTGNATADLNGATFDVSTDAADTLNKVTKTTATEGMTCVGDLPWSSRTVSASMQNGDTGLTLSTGSLSASDEGATVTGAGIQSGTTISVTDSTDAVMSKAAIATESNEPVTIAGTIYYVTETTPPSGYALPTTATQPVVVSQNGTCDSGSTATLKSGDQTITLTSGTFGSGDLNGTVADAKSAIPVSTTTVTTIASITDATTAEMSAAALAAETGDAVTIAANASLVSFTDVPLTNLTVTAQSVVAGATNSTITCSTSTSFLDNIGNSPQGASSTATVSASNSNTPANALTPGYYYCRIFVDP